MKETAIETIRRLQNDDFSGTLTIHMHCGKVRKIEQLKTWKPPREPDETIGLMEDRKRV